MTRLFLTLLLVWTTAAAAQSEPRAEFVSSYFWRQPVKWFGGFSGMDLTADGSHFWVVSDQGFGSKVRVVRDPETGNVVELADYQNQWLTQPDGKVMQGIQNDAEGMAVSADGDVYVSFEGAHRIQVYKNITKLTGPWPTPQAIPPHPEFANLQHNSSLEALAVAPDGALLAIPERSGLLTRPFPVYRYRNGVWDADLTIRREPPFLVVGADFGPDGKFYLLERHLNGFFGFQSRVRRFDYGADGLTNEVTLFQSRSARHDNLEAISVWRDAEGNIRLTMVSDNNFKPFQRNELVEYVVKE